MKKTAHCGRLPLGLLAIVLPLALTDQAMAGDCQSAPPARCCCRNLCDPGPSYHALKAEALGIVSAFMPYSRYLDRMIERSEHDRPVPKDLVERLVSLEEQIQHVYAETLEKVERRCKIQKQIERIRAELCHLHADWNLLSQDWSSSAH